MYLCCPFLGVSQLSVCFLPFMITFLQEKFACCWQSLQLDYQDQVRLDTCGTSYCTCVGVQISRE